MDETSSFFPFFSDFREIVKILLKNGADVVAICSTCDGYDADIHGYETIGTFGHSRSGFATLDVFPLYLAARFGGAKTIKMLLLAGADVNQRTATGQTALHIACTTRDGSQQTRNLSLNKKTSYHVKETKPLRILIEKGAHVNIIDDYGKSPLHYAAKCGNSFFVSILLEHGANVYLKDNAGMTVLEYAATADYKLTMALLDKYEFPIEQVIKACECVALRAPSPLDVLRKAFHLREVHKIPKKVLPPLECYCFEKEWETVGELEKYDGGGVQLLLQHLLTHERLSMEYNHNIVPHMIVFGKKSIIITSGLMSHQFQ